MLNGSQKYFKKIILIRYKIWHYIFIRAVFTHQLFLSEKTGPSKYTIDFLNIFFPCAELVIGIPTNNKYMAIAYFTQLLTYIFPSMNLR